MDSHGRHGQQFGPIPISRYPWHRDRIRFQRQRQRRKHRLGLPAAHRRHYRHRLRCQGGLLCAEPCGQRHGLWPITGWQINWGDGSVDQVSGNPSSVTHVYDESSPSYQIQATAINAAGTYSTGTAAACTVNVIPVRYWDPAGNTSSVNINTGAGLGGAGTWADGSGDIWYSPYTHAAVAWDNTANWIAVFEGGADTVTVSGTVSAAGLQFATDGSDLSGGTLSLPAGATTAIDVSSLCTATIASALDGSGGLTKTGAGTLALSGTGDATGDTTVQQGTLVAGSAGAIGSGDLVVNDTFDLAGNDTTVASLAGSSSGIVESSGGLGTLYLDGDSTTDTTFSGTLQDGPGGQLALEMDGTGTQVLAAANTFTGGTTVTAGILALAYSYDSTGTLPAGQLVSVDGGALEMDAQDALGTGAGLPSEIDLEGGILATNGGSFHITLGPLDMAGGMVAAPAGSGDVNGVNYILTSNVVVTTADTPSVIDAPNVLGPKHHHLG